MFFKIADFLIHVQGGKDIPFFSAPFYVPFPHNSPHIKIKIIKNDFKKDRKIIPIFKTRNWEIYRDNKRALIFIDKFNKRKTGYSRILVLDEKVKQGKLYLNIRKSNSAFSYLENPIVYPLGPLILLYKFLWAKGLFIHGAAVKDTQGMGYVFIGHSGVGKTTMAKIWLKFKKGRVLNDERAIIKSRGDKFYLYGCPWFIRSEKFICSEKAELKRIFFLKGISAKINVKKIPPSKSVREMMGHLHIPWWEQKGVSIAFNIVEKLVKKVECFEISFVPLKHIIDLIFK